VYAAKICNLCGVCAHTTLAYCKREKHQKPNSDYGLHKHFAALPITKSSMAIDNTKSEWKNNVNTMLSFSQHAKFK
jgi:hypothetical protein